MGEIQRIDKVLSSLGYGTRKEIKKLIKEGTVQVDGQIVYDPGMHIDPEVQIMSISGNRIDYKKYIYIMMNKPMGVISATYDPKDKTVLDLLPEEYKVFDPFPVGRLDKDTVGLLLLTNDGQLAHKLLSPKKHVPKIYKARISGKVTEEDVLKFKEGVVLDDGYKSMPAELKIIEQGETSSIEVLVYEGKYHQVKRMFEALDKKVLFLMRVSMGPISLDENLSPGESRELSEIELKSVLEFIENKNC